MNEKISHIIFLKVTETNKYTYYHSKMVPRKFHFTGNTLELTHILYKIKKDFPEKQTALCYKKSLPAETKALDYEF